VEKCAVIRVYMLEAMAGDWPHFMSVSETVKAVFKEKEAQ
jgi:hypothetical protein